MQQRVVAGGQRGHGAHHISIMRVRGGGAGDRAGDARRVARGRVEGGDVAQLVHLWVAAGAVQHEGAAAHLGGLRRARHQALLRLAQRHLPHHLRLLRVGAHLPRQA